MSRIPQAQVPQAPRRQVQRPVAAAPRPAQPVLANVPARPANVPPPDVDQSLDVPSLIYDIEGGLRALQGNAAGFAALNRLADGDKSEPPMFSWPSSFNGKPVEVITDLSDLPKSVLLPLLDPLVNIHGRQMLEAAKRIAASATSLVLALEAVKKNADDADAAADGQEAEGEPQNQE